METTITGSDSLSAEESVLAKFKRAAIGFVTRSNEEWIALSTNFLKWRHKKHVEGLSAKEASEADAIHTMLLRSARLMHAQMVDPNFSDRSMASRVQAILWHLEDTWQATHNTMSDAEAEAILRQVFPDEPRT
jgi:hypothetical protein